jgi:hypothetical protein
MLLAEGPMAEGIVRYLRAWLHTRFGTHVGRTISLGEKTPAAVAQYMARRLVTPKRMLGGADRERMIYRPDAVYPRH